MTSPISSKSKLKLSAFPNTIPRTNSLAKLGLFETLDFQFPAQEKEVRSEPQNVNLPLKFKESSNIVIDSLLMESNIGLDINTSDLSIIKILEEENFKAKYGGDNQLRNEIKLLKKQLALKGNIIEKLAKENCDLRERMGELLQALEDSKATVTSQVDEFNKIIRDLKLEIESLSKEKANIHDSGKNSSKISAIEEVYFKSSKDLKEKMDEFYKKLTHQMSEFIDSSKAQYQTYAQTMQSHVEKIKNAKSPRNIDKIVSIQSQKKKSDCKFQVR